MLVSTFLHDASRTSNCKYQLLTSNLVTLPAHYSVWLSSPEAAYLNGKFVWSNWDVTELKERAKEIQNSPMLTTNIIGWPFQS